jgi:hypothetical protein
VHRAALPDYLSHTGGAPLAEQASTERPLCLVPPGAAPAARRVITPTTRDRRLLALAVRHGRLVPSQAWRWEWPTSSTVRPARNRLSELVAAGVLLLVPLRRGEDVYVPTAAGARLVRALTGGLAAPKAPTEAMRRWLAQLGHDLTVAEVERWLLRRAPTGARFLTERELVREWTRSLPPRLRRGAAGMRFRPDGAVVLPAGERIAVEVELHAKAAERLGDKLRWYRDEAGYVEVLWLVPPAGVEEPLWDAIAAVDPKAELMAVETLPPACLVYAR